MRKLRVYETFYSIQGEGLYMGMPAVFLRLAGCNINCSFCDTKFKKSQAYTFNQLYKIWRSKGYIKHLRNGAHLVVTGGEPLLQQEVLPAFFHYIWNKVDSWISPFIEVETNATIVPNQDFDMWVNYYNCSPKLKNSGVKKSKRWNEEALKFFVEKASKNSACFKFVIINKNDIKEVLKFVKKFRVEPNTIFLMPEGKSEKDLERKRKFVVELCKKYYFNYSDRLQLLIWNRTKGV
jgi:7-carboxy-7-deazaguanine synthase